MLEGPLAALRQRHDGLWNRISLFWKEEHVKSPCHPQEKIDCDMALISPGVVFACIRRFQAIISTRVKETVLEIKTNEVYYNPISITS